MWAFKVEDGAMVIDINLDDGLLDGMAAMQKFCKIAVTEPDVSKVTPAWLSNTTAFFVVPYTHKTLVDMG